MAELEVWGAEGAGVLQEIESWVRWSGRQGRVGKESPSRPPRGDDRTVRAHRAVVGRSVAGLPAAPRTVSLGHRGQLKEEVN